MIDRASERAVLHERDDLRDKVAHLERQLSDHQAKHRHWVALTCDRCKTSLTISSATKTGDLEMCHALAQAAIALRWTFSQATADALFCPGAANHLTTDACPACSTLIDSVFTQP
jgi:hypothetical protein